MLVGILTLVLCSLAGQNDPTVAELVESLGSSRFADRQRASDSLLKLGIEARPALDAARSARDPEIRQRASWLLETIDSQALTRPSRIQLDVTDRPLDEVAREIGKQAGFDLELPANVPGLSQHARKPVTLRIDPPVGFWTAFDRLREASGIPLILDEPIARRDGRGIAELRVDRTASLGVDDDGPIRGEVVGFSRRGDFGFLVQVRLRAEPRLRLRVAASPRDVEARDEFGNAIAGAPDPLRDPSEITFAESDQGGGILIWMPLERPVDVGQTLKRFKFTVPVVLATRRDEPTATIPFGEIEGKAQVLEDLILVGRRPNPLGGFGGGMGSQVQLLIRGAVPERRADLCDDQLELRDSAGRLIPRTNGSLALPWRGGGMGRGLAGQNIAFRIYSLSGDDRGFPEEVRYYGLRQAETAVTLEFHDLPLPLR